MTKKLENQRFKNKEKNTIKKFLKKIKKSVDKALKLMYNKNRSARAGT